MSTLLQDLKYGLRMLAKNPGFTVVAVLTLALGIGVNTAVFTVVDALVLRRMPVSNPDELVTLSTKSSQTSEVSLSYPDYQDIRQQVNSFSGVAVYARETRFLNSLDESAQVLVDEVTPDYFKVLGLQALFGRVFSPDVDNKPQSGEGVVISYRLWQGRLGGDPSIVGKEIKLNGGTATVIGVTPPFFQGVARLVPTDMWLLTPYAIDLNSAKPPKRSDLWFECVARLKHGVTPAQASAELEGLAQRLARVYPETNRGRTFGLSPVTMDQHKSWFVGLISMALPSLVLLIACANLAGLLLARAETRRQELAVRLALGAGRWRLTRQFLAGGLLLAGLGGSLGLILTAWLMSFQRALMPAAYSFIGPDMRIDYREAAFTTSIALLATLMFSLTPATHAWKVGLGSVIKGNEGVVRGSRRVTARNVLVAGQMALSVVLITVSLLFLRSLHYVRNLPMGFDTHKNLAVVNMFSLEDTPSAQFLPPLVKHVAGLPGVKRATYARRMLLSGSGGGATVQVSIPGFQLPEGQSTIPIRLNAVGPDYFQTVGTHILQGRDFTSSDSPTAQKVAIVSQFTARRFWPHGDAVGRFVRIEGIETQIVGIAEDAKIIHIHEPPQPYMYLPYAQPSFGWGAALIVECAGNPATVIPLLRREIHAYNSSLIIWGVDTVKSLLDLSTLDSLVESWVVGILSLVGVFLAAMGLYGVVACIVRSRTREIGIRLALGARLGQVEGLFVFHGLVLALIGVLAGLLTALGVGHLVAGLIYGVKPYDPLCLSASAGAVIVISLVACYLPTRRVTKVDPMVALRYE